MDSMLCTSCEWVVRNRSWDELRTEFHDLDLTKYDNLRGWHTNGTDTVLIVESGLGKYDAYVWNNPNARAQVFDAVLALLKLLK